MEASKERVKYASDLFKQVLVAYPAMKSDSLRWPGSLLHIAKQACEALEANALEQFITECERLLAEEP